VLYFWGKHGDYPLSIVDAEGNGHSVTTTLNGAYGSKVYIDRVGILMNNDGPFQSKSWSSKCLVELAQKPMLLPPGKRMLSSMTQDIVERDGHLDGGGNLVALQFHLSCKTSQML